jgi:hypothetical protein
MNYRLTLTASAIVLSLSALAGADTDSDAKGKWIPVSGTGKHLFSSAIVHSKTDTAVGYRQRSSETVELEGDLTGRVLYHPVSTFDFQAGTLVNTGNQVFSGTVLGSEPVLLHDERFRFEVDLATGATVGKVFLTEHIAGPKVRCELSIDSAGERTAEGDAVLSYTGRCRFRGAS